MRGSCCGLWREVEASEQLVTADSWVLWSVLLGLERHGIPPLRFRSPCVPLGGESEEGLCFNV